MRSMNRGRLAAGTTHRELPVQQRITSERHGDDRCSSHNGGDQHRHDAGMRQGTQAHRDCRQACEWPPQKSSGNAHHHRRL